MLSFSVATCVGQCEMIQGLVPTIDGIKMLRWILLVILFYIMCCRSMVVAVTGKDIEIIEFF